MRKKIFIQSVYNKDIFKENAELQQRFHEHFQYARDLSRERELPELDGAIVSTAGLKDIHQEGYFSQPDLVELFEWIKTEMLTASSVLCDQAGVDLQGHRVGVNVMYQGAAIDDHIHNMNGLVGVFYLSAPKDSAKLILTDTAITPHDNTLVIHDGMIRHGVSKHTPIEPRISLIVEAIEN